VSAATMLADVIVIYFPVKGSSCEKINYLCSNYYTREEGSQKPIEFIDGPLRRHNFEVYCQDSLGETRFKYIL